MLHYACQFYGPAAGKLLGDVAHWVVRHKYFSFHRFIYKKVASLSIRERIATSVANILRHHRMVTLTETWSESKHLLCRTGLVDDCL